MYSQIDLPVFVRGGRGLHFSGLALLALLVSRPAQAENPIVELPKLNQVGFLPNATKGCTFTVLGGTPPLEFEITDEAGTFVYRGAFSSAFDDTSSTLETVVKGDFSALVAPGRYVLRVGESVSHPFVVDESVFTPLYRDATRAFYLIRSGVAISDAETGLTHAASHTKDAQLRADGVTQLDLTGGWYNAGDFGKWSHMAAITSAYLLWLHELRGNELALVSLGIPESGDGVPDLLDQARWGLEWLLKMQRADGAVIHKVDTEPNFAWGLAPESDPNTRYASDVGTIDTADFTAVMTLAGQSYRASDPVFAERCEASALRAASWLDAQPPGGNVDPYYKDANDSAERFWALAERARVSNGALDERLTAELANRSFGPISWMDPALFGLFGVARDTAVPESIRTVAKAKLVAVADGLVTLSASSGYGVAAAANGYYWGSVEGTLHGAAALLFAFELTQDPRYHSTAIAQLDYVLGRNSLGHSFVTGYGEASTQHPFHWAAHSLGIVFPGWASGGPNSLAPGADPALLAVQQDGRPPAKCYIDQGDGQGSWASNEGQTTENAALAFVSGYFAHAVPTPSSAEAPAAGGAPAATALETADVSGCNCSVVGTDRTEIPTAPFLAACLIRLGLRRQRNCQSRRMR